MSSANMTGKICLVTGGNSGIGKATAIGLAKMGATVVIVSRSREKGEMAINDIVGKSENKNVEMILADMSSQDSIRQLADEFKAKHEKLHLLINNAGVYLTNGPPLRMVSNQHLQSTILDL